MEVRVQPPTESTWDESGLDVPADRGVSQAPVPVGQKKPVEVVVHVSDEALSVKRVWADESVRAYELRDIVGREVGIAEAVLSYFQVYIECSEFAYPLAVNDVVGTALPLLDKLCRQMYERRIALDVEARKADKNKGKNMEAPGPYLPCALWFRPAACSIAQFEQRITDPAALEVGAGQACRDVAAGRYPLSENDMADFAAGRVALRLGEGASDSDVKRELQKDIELYIPHGLVKQKGEKKWVSAVAAAYQRSFTQAPRIAVRRCILKLARSFPYYGSCMLPARANAGQKLLKEGELIPIVVVNSGLHLFQVENGVFAWYMCIPLQDLKFMKKEYDSNACVFALRGEKTPTVTELMVHPRMASVLEKLIQANVELLRMHAKELAAIAKAVQEKGPAEAALGPVPPNAYARDPPGAKTGGPAMGRSSGGDSGGDRFSSGGESAGLAVPPAGIPQRKLSSGSSLPPRKLSGGPDQLVAPPSPARLSPTPEMLPGLAGQPQGMAAPLVGMPGMPAPPPGVPPMAMIPEVGGQAVGQRLPGLAVPGAGMAGQRVPSPQPMRPAMQPPMMPGAPAGLMPPQVQGARRLSYDSSADAQQSEVALARRARAMAAAQCGAPGGQRMSLPASKPPPPPGPPPPLGMPAVYVGQEDAVQYGQAGAPVPGQPANMPARRMTYDTGAGADGRQCELAMARAARAAAVGQRPVSPLPPGQRPVSPQHPALAGMPYGSQMQTLPESSFYGGAQQGALPGLGQPVQQGPVYGGQAAATQAASMPGLGPAMGGYPAQSVQLGPVYGGQAAAMGRHPPQPAPAGAVALPGLSPPAMPPPQMQPGVQRTAPSAAHGGALPGLGGGNQRQLVTQQQARGRGAPAMSGGVALPGLDGGSTAPVDLMPNADSPDLANLSLDSTDSSDCLIDPAEIARREAMFGTPPVDQFGTPPPGNGDFFNMAMKQQHW